MKLSIQSPKKALKPFLKMKPLRSEIDIFKANLIALLDKINVIEKLPKDETEEHLKNNLRDFLRDTYYKDTNAINTKDKKDLVIHLSKTTDSEVGVIIEAKRPTNINEMISAANPNKKALHELILYYFNERITNSNNQLKQLVITNINEWYIINANHFDKKIYDNPKFKKLYEIKVNDKKDNPWFYEEVSKIIANTDVEIPCIYFDIKQYETALRNTNKEGDKELITLFKILSPLNLLKVSTPNDSNSLNEKFYKELLHIIGLEEAKEGGKNIIRRKLEDKSSASFIEMSIKKLRTKGVHKIADIKTFGETTDEQYFNIALELCITWINRILFLKLLEGQLITYHTPSLLERARGEAYQFLNTKTIHDFDELFKLFHNVLAVNIKDREQEVQQKYKLVPYLNSSLFEISELEDVTICIDSLDNSETLQFNSSSILSKNKKAGLQTLQYLFNFLDAYDFASEGTEEVQEDNKTIITASVLGKVFEKINGYKDGSIFTPAFITMYMCKQSIRLAVVQKFNEALAQKNETLFDKFEDVKNYTTRLFKTQEILNANEIINSLHICDPAVGSGHFLVSALNEIICIKAELGILADQQGNSISGYEIEVINDELIITDPKGNSLEYKMLNQKPLSNNIQHLQKTLFHEKQTIIENCLFGVDINPNSVKICRLRLWIELLKNAYYKAPSPLEKAGDEAFLELETLPNIDINIKCGNSLLSRFALDADLSKALKSIKYNINAYRGFVADYKNCKDRESKRFLTKIIDGIKADFRTEIFNNDPKLKKLKNLQADYYKHFESTMFVKSKSQEKDLYKTKENYKKAQQRKEKLETEINKLSTEIEEIKTNAIYKNAFEWRFEFPEVLNNKGDFNGFDLVIGNPPYIRQEEIKHQKKYLLNNYKTYSSSADMYVFFVERGFELLKNTGNFSYIIPNKWMQAGYGKAMRSFLLDKQLHSIIDFGDLQVFDNVTTYPCILSASKIKTENIFQSTVVKTLKFDKGFDEYVNINYNPINSKELSDENWLISSNAEQELLSKIKVQSVSLTNYIKGNSYRGILTGLSEAFLIDTKIKEQLIKEDINSKRFIKPFLQGRSIKPYANSKAKNWLILIPKGFTIKRNLPPTNINYVKEPGPHYGNMPYDDAWEWFKENYPAIAKHLLPYKSKAEARTDKGDYWWELRACDYYNEFEKPKIMYQVLQVKPCFIYDDTKQYCNNSMWIIPKDDKCLVGILNSKIGWWLISKHCTAIQNGYQLIWKYFGQIPIPKMNTNQQKQMNDLVDKIISAKQQDKNTSTLEKQIDEMVYNLYGLTAEEVKIVENT